MVSDSIERLRVSYKPNIVKVLFIGESAPAGGTFFYKANSNLFRCTREAFSIVYGDKCGMGTDFLEFFKSIGCYLDDLCLEPVNKLDECTRNLKRDEAVPFLAERVRIASPRAVIGVMKGISQYVWEAIRMSAIGEIHTSFLPFPGRYHQRKYTYLLVDNIQRLKEAGILLI